MISVEKMRPRARALGPALSLMVAVVGCGVRDRLVFPGPGNALGPTTVILQPGADTTVPAGPGLVVYGYMTDPDLVDTLYAETTGGVTVFPPFTFNLDTVYFNLPLTTNGQSGQTITIMVFGTDKLGFRGDTAVRQITVQ